MSNKTQISAVDPLETLLYQVGVVQGRQEKPRLCQACKIEGSHSGGRQLGGHATSCVATATAPQSGTLQGLGHPHAAPLPGQIFVAASDRVTVAKLADILNVDVPTLR